MSLMVVTEDGRDRHTLCARHRQTVTCMLVEDQSGLADACELCAQEADVRQSIAHKRETREAMMGKVQLLQTQIGELRREVDLAMGDGIVGEFTFGRLRELDKALEAAVSDLRTAVFVLRTF